MNWTYDHIAGTDGGGEKWRLHAADNAGTPLATIIRLPGTQSRVFWPRGEVLWEDFPTVREAFARVRKEYGDLVPLLPGRSDLYLLRGNMLAPGDPEWTQYETRED